MGSRSGCVRVRVNIEAELRLGLVSKLGLVISLGLRLSLGSMEKPSHCWSWSCHRGWSVVGDRVWVEVEVGVGDVTEIGVAVGIRA